MRSLFYVRIALGDETMTTQKKQPPTWRQMHLDTTPEAEVVLFKLLRAAPTWKKWRRMEDMNRTTRLLAVIGLRRRYPQATEEEIRRRLADLILGPELAERVYGPLYIESRS
jgi:hypothetical protein